MSSYSSLFSSVTTTRALPPSTIPSIDIDLLGFDRPSSRASSSSSSPGLYIPVHRRKLSSCSSSVSSAPSSPTPSSISFTASDGQSSANLSAAASVTNTPAVPVYSVDDLILMSHSPLARMAEEDRLHMRESAPEIFLSNKQKRRMEWRANAASWEKAARQRALGRGKESQHNKVDSWRS